MNLPQWIYNTSELLSQRRKESLMRTRQIVEPIDAVHVKIDGTPYVNFCSNNYLGLTHHPRIIDAFSDHAKTVPAGSGAAGLITGYTNLHAQCEQRLAAWKQTEQAILLPSGYQANLAAIQTLAAIGQSYPDGVRFLIDKLAHASIIDAVRATESPMRVFPHNNLQKLERLLSESDPQKQLQVVLTESIFSMDGDAADLQGLALLKEKYPFVLLLDEAHGSGVYGINGAGLASEMGLQKIVDVSVVTLSKSLGCGGGAVCASKIFCDALLNFGRAYIYSTSVPPLIPASVVAALDVIQTEPWRAQRVRELARRVRSELAAEKFSVPPGDSPIIPVLIGSEAAALAAAEELKSNGLLVIAVRPPTVPPGSSRLRITLSCEHSDAEVDQLVESVNYWARNRSEVAKGDE